MSDHEIQLSGIDGSNLLGFLAALGAFRILSKARPDDETKLAWQLDTAWRPVLLTGQPVSTQHILEILSAASNEIAGHAALTWANDIKASVAEYREMLESSVATAPSEPTLLEYLSAFATDAYPDRDSLVPDTAFRTMRGAGHQHLLKTMREVAGDVTPDHLERTLFKPWDYADPIEQRSLRFEAAADRRHAYQWRNPSGDPSRKKGGSMLGGNFLASLALPLFPVVPLSSRAATTGFVGSKSSEIRFRWPIWKSWLSINVVSSLLSSSLSVDDDIDYALLERQGITAVFSSQRLTLGKFRNFAPSDQIF